MRKWILGIGLLGMLLLFPNLAYAESLDSTVDSARKILKIGTGVVIGFVTLGVLTTAGGWLLDIAQKQKLRIYMEISVYLIGLIVVIGFFLAVIFNIRNLANI